MKEKRERGKQRIIIHAIPKPLRHMKRSSVEPQIENVEETGCLEPAFSQNTYEEGDVYKV